MLTMLTFLEFLFHCSLKVAAKKAAILIGAGEEEAVALQAAGRIAHPVSRFYPKRRALGEHLGWPGNIAMTMKSNLTLLEVPYKK